MYKSGPLAKIELTLCGLFVVGVWFIAAVLFLWPKDTATEYKPYCIFPTQQGKVAVDNRNCTMLRSAGVGEPGTAGTAQE